MEKYAAAGTKALLIGNKCDLQEDRVVTEEQGRALAESLGLQHVEASAKSAHNVELAFEKLVTTLVACSAPSPPNPAKLAGLGLHKKAGKDAPSSTCAC